MNAYELADELLDCGKFFEDRLYTKAGNILRQQADRIELLEQQVKDALEIGIAEGFAKALTQYPPVTIPQTKPLSDEEILDIWYEHNNGSSDWTEFVKFARKIEERILGE